MQKVWAHCKGAIGAFYKHIGHKGELSMGYIINIIWAGELDGGFLRHFDMFLVSGDEKLIFFDKITVFINEKKEVSH